MSAGGAVAQMLTTLVPVKGGVYPFLSISFHISFSVKS